MRLTMESRLEASLQKDRQRNSNLRRGSDGVTVVSVSNRSVGIAIAIESRTGERSAIDRIAERLS